MQPASAHAVHVLSCQHVDRFISLRGIRHVSAPHPPRPLKKTFHCLRGSQEERQRVEVPPSCTHLKIRFCSELKPCRGGDVHELRCPKTSDRNDNGTQSRRGVSFLLICRRIQQIVSTVAQMENNVYKNVKNT